MWVKGLILTAIFLSIWLSIKQKIYLKQKRNALNQIPDEPVKSVLSEALAQLVGIAGGIYLSLIMLVSFLELDIPGKISISGISMQPLALLALFLALIQPVIATLQNKFTGS